MKCRGAELRERMSHTAPGSTGGRLGENSRQHQLGDGQSDKQHEYGTWRSTALRYMTRTRRASRWPITPKVHPCTEAAQQAGISGISLEWGLFSCHPMLAAVQAHRFLELRAWAPPHLEGVCNHGAQADADKDQTPLAAGGRSQAQEVKRLNCGRQPLAWLCRWAVVQAPGKAEQ